MKFVELYKGTITWNNSFVTSKRHFCFSKDVGSLYVSMKHGSEIYQSEAFELREVYRKIYPICALLHFFGPSLPDIFQA